MRHVYYLLLIFPVILSANTITDFISAADSNLYDGDKIFRFVSCNVPNLIYIDNNFGFDQTNTCRLANDFEIRDALESIKQMGGQVVKIGALSVKGEIDQHNPGHVSGSAAFNEEKFRTLDRVLFFANKMEIRLIISLIDSRTSCKRAADPTDLNRVPFDFWYNKELIQDFKQTIQYILNRKNIYTRQLYKNDKTILAWEIVPEPDAPVEWTNQILEFVKQIDANHLLIAGTGSEFIDSQLLNNTLVDIVCSQHNSANSAILVNQIEYNTKLVNSTKPYIVLDFGSTNAVENKQVLNTIVNQKIAGIFVSNLTFHNRDGGFYHFSGCDSLLINTIYWQGLALHDSLSMTFSQQISSYAYKIKDKVYPPVKPPAPPELLPVDDISAINWQGSVGAEYYHVERASSLTGKWKTIAKNIKDADCVNRPLFHDKTVNLNQRYYYRVIAENAAGQSQPSNWVRSSWVKSFTLRDYFDNLKNISFLAGDAIVVDSPIINNASTAHQLLAQKDALIEYDLPGQVYALELLAMYPDSLYDVDFFASQSGGEYVPVQFDREIVYNPDLDNSGSELVMYHINRFPVYSTKIRVKCNTKTQFARVEIKYGN